VLVLGVVTYISGLRLAGVPVNMPDWMRGNGASQQSSVIPTKTIVKAYIPATPALPTVAAPGVDPVSLPATEPSVSAPVANTGGPVATEEAGPPTEAMVAELYLNALNYGYDPQVLYASAGTPVKLNVVTNNTRSCAIAFVIPELNYETLLPTSGRTTIDIPAQEPGKVMGFTCSMGMYTGEIVFQ